MEQARRQALFQRYAAVYQAVFEEIYPAKHSTGFPERNLSVNFSKAYEQLSAGAGERAFSWFEFQFGTRNNFHVDALLWNPPRGELLLVESKRFTSQQKVPEAAADMERVRRLLSELREENRQGVFRLDLSKMRRCYGVILADVWTENPFKRDVLKRFQAGVADPASPESFLAAYCPGPEGKALPGLAYDVRDMACIPKYHLLSFLWRVE